MMTDQFKELFKIETNINFEWVESPVEENLQAIATHYALPAIKSLYQLRKRNQASVMYRLVTESGDYVVRGVRSESAVYLETQCEIAASNPLNGFVKPLKGNSQYCFEKEGQTWIAYPYCSGNVFTGSETNIPEIVKGCLANLKWLKETGTDYKLNQADYEQETWVAAISELTSESRLTEDPFPRLLSGTTMDLLKENRSMLVQMAKEASEMDLAANRGLTHNDLNHANVVVQDDKALVLDIEHLCEDNIDIAAAHCIFRLIRHAVYEGHSSLADAKEKLLPGALAAVDTSTFKIGSKENFYQYAKVKIVSDLNYIMNRILVERANPLPTDLEKKIWYLFELHQLTN